MKFTSIPLALLVTLSASAPLLAAPPWHGPGMTPPPLPMMQQYQHHQVSRIHIRRSSGPEGYRVKITLGGQPADSLQITIKSGRLLIEQQMANEARQPGDRGGRSQLRSWSRMSQQVSLPRDADIERMSREESDGVITLTIPRRPFRPR